MAKNVSTAEKVTAIDEFVRGNRPTREQLIEKFGRDFFNDFDFLVGFDFFTDFFLKISIFFNQRTQTTKPNKI